LTSRLTDEQTTDGIQGQSVNLFARRAGTGGELGAGTATTSTDGMARFTPTPSATTTYRTSFAGSDTHGLAESPQVTVTVRPRVTARLKASTVTMSSSITVSGTVTRTTTARRCTCNAWPAAPGRAWPPAP
jgi:hypothetical protein